MMGKQGSEGLVVSRGAVPPLGRPDKYLSDSGTLRSESKQFAGVVTKKGWRYTGCPDTLVLSIVEGSALLAMTGSLPAG